MLFKKSHLLYGADLARKAIAQRYQAVVVEGYTDVMACHLAGVETAVATCGTAFGEDHVKLLRRLLHDQDESRGEVIFTFDGDRPARTPPARRSQFDQRFVGQTFVAIEPRTVATRASCGSRRATPPSASWWRTGCRSSSSPCARRSSRSTSTAPRGGSAALRAAVPLVAGIKDWVLRDEYARRLVGLARARAPEPVLAAGAGDARRDRARARASGPRRARGSGSADDVRCRPRAGGAQGGAAAARPRRPGVRRAGAGALHAAPVHRELHAAIVAAGRRPVGHRRRRLGRPGRRRRCADDETRRLVPALAVEPLHYEGDGEERYIASVDRPAAGVPHHPPDSRA